MKLFVKKVSGDVWKKFLKSNAATWLPKPPEGTYDRTNYSRYESYFTPKGQQKFQDLTLPAMNKYAKMNVKQEQVSSSSLRGWEIVYQDPYQVIYGFGKKN